MSRRFPGKLWGTMTHISSSGCRGQKKVVTLAHDNVFRDLMFDVSRHQKKTSVKDFTTVGTEKTLGSLWEREEYISLLKCNVSCLYGGCALARDLRVCGRIALAQSTVPSRHCFPACSDAF